MANEDELLQMHNLKPAPGAKKGPYSHRVVGERLQG